MHQCGYISTSGHTRLSERVPLFFSLYCILKWSLLKYCKDAWQHGFYLLESGHTCNLGLPQCKNLWIFLCLGVTVCVLYIVLGLFVVLLIVLCFTSLVSFTGFYTKDEPVISCKFIWLLIQKGWIGLFNKEKIM